MAQFFTDFSEYADGNIATVSGGQFVLQRTGGTWTRNVASGVFVLDPTTDGDQYHLVALDGSEESGDIEVYAKMACAGSAANNFYPIGAALIATASDACYAMQPTSGTSWRTAYFDASGSQLGSIGSPQTFASPAANAVFHIRLGRSSGNIRWKAWADGSAEPGSWMDSAADASLGEVRAGLVAFSYGAGPYRFLAFGSGTDGDPAPTSGVEPSPDPVLLVPGDMFRYTGGSVVSAASETVTANVYAVDEDGGDWNIGEFQYSEEVEVPGSGFIVLANAKNAPAGKQMAVGIQFNDSSEQSEAVLRLESVAVADGDWTMASPVFGGYWVVNGDFGGTGNSYVGDITDFWGVSEVAIGRARFTGVSIPEGATILSATLGLTVTSQIAGGGGDVIIRGDSRPDPTALNFTTVNPLSWPPTTASALMPAGANGARSVDVTAVVQEMVNLSGWGGGGMHFMMRTVDESADWILIDYTTYALHIEWAA